MFRLSRYYSIASLIGIAVVIITLSVFFRHLALKSLMAHQTRANEALATSFSNTFWAKHADFINATRGQSPDQFRNHPQIAELLADVQSQMRGTNVAKVKVYNLDGMTVFSTDAKQIGKDKSDSEGFQAALKGISRSEITFRNEFYALEQVILDRNLVASYIPVVRNNEVKAVFELYSDVTELVKNMENSQRVIIGGVIAALALLYLFLFIIVKRADTIITRQELERQSQEEKIRYQAFHDSLTGLPNRASFNDRIVEACLRAQRHGKCGALLFMDLDRFKLINDSLGHDAGDQMLMITARRMMNSLREVDQAFRISGDEFLIIIEDLDRPEDSAFAAQRIIDAMAKPVTLGDHQVYIFASIGMTIFTDTSKDIETLVREADAAMYKAKETGHNHYEFFTPDMNDRAADRLALETDLKRALDNNEFELHFQPKMDINGGHLTGMEALIRWHHPQRGLLPPTMFIPLLEDTGLITSVGEWVLRQACEQAQTWRQSGGPDLRISVNVSARQFRNPQLPTIVERALKDTGLPGRNLELELTESMFIDDVHQAMSTMHKLKEMGIYLSIDDFGTGYSSLNYLKQFPIDFLKIDRSFIRDLGNSERDSAITTAIAGLAHSLKMGLVAEGVEEPAQLEILRSHGCHEVQGFLVSEPLPAEEFEKLVLQKLWAGDAS